MGKWTAALTVADREIIPVMNAARNFIVVVAAVKYSRCCLISQ
jgi:hypothetical protein